jgi:hypothetical protein
MSREYVYRQPDGDWTKMVDLATLLSAAGKRVEPGFKPYVVTLDGDPITPALDRSTALRRFRRGIAENEIGPVFRIRDSRTVQFTARAVQAFVDADTTNGNEKADRLWNWVTSVYSEYHPRYAGAYVCKPKSQHRFGNAIDVFFDTLDHQDRVCSRAVELADELELQHVISRQRIWTKGVGWHPYVGDFHWHGHFDFAPNFATSHACGVRG